MSAGREEFARVPHKDGELFGVLHLAENPESAICVIMLTSGMQTRVGPGRLYLTAARAFAKAGINVIRVDLSGAGDAEGDNSVSHFDCHDPNEADSVIRYAKERLNPRAIIMNGLCAGARVSIKASRSPDVDGVIAWSVPIFSASLNMPQSPLEPEDRVSGAVARDSVARLTRFVFTLRFLDPRWWRKTFPGGSGLLTEVKLVGRSIVRFVRPTDPETAMNPFFAATEAYLEAGRKVLFTYGDLDQLSYLEFRDRFPDLVEDGLAPQGYSIVENGTHTFASRSAQLEAIEHALRWLAQNFPDDEGSAAAA